MFPCCCCSFCSRDIYYLCSGVSTYGSQTTCSSLTFCNGPNVSSMCFKDHGLYQWYVRGRSVIATVMKVQQKNKEEELMFRPVSQNNGCGCAADRDAVSFPQIIATSVTHYFQFSAVFCRETQTRGWAAENAMRNWSVFFTEVTVVNAQKSL